MNVLCIFGIHKWHKERFFDQYSSNVREHRKECARCGKVKRWIEPKLD